MFARTPPFTLETIFSGVPFRLPLQTEVFGLPFRRRFFLDRCHRRGEGKQGKHLRSQGQGRRKGRGFSLCAVLIFPQVRDTTGELDVRSTVGVNPYVSGAGMADKGRRGSRIHPPPAVATSFTRRRSNWLVSYTVCCAWLRMKRSRLRPKRSRGESNKSRLNPSGSCWFPTAAGDPFDPRGGGVGGGGMKDAQLPNLWFRGLPA